MGRVRNTFIKRNTRKIMNEHGDKFTEDFQENKKILDEVVETFSKKVRNRIAGYITYVNKKGITLKRIQ